eukprot:XP_001706062.1 Hypothetical protein GL50803_24519 [Giardia lamblia ATCC 50803]
MFAFVRVANSAIAHVRPYGDISYVGREKSSRGKSFICDKKADQAS